MAQTRSSSPRMGTIHGARLSPLTPEVESELAAIAASSGCELLHAEWKGGVLRLILDRPEGIALGDCEQVSKQASALLDLLDFGAGRYLLEVSSPGLDRQLYRARDYQRFLGRLARVSFADPAAPGGRDKRTIVGRLVDFTPPAAASAAAGEATIEEEPSGKRHVIALDTIRQARLEVEVGLSEKKEKR